MNSTAIINGKEIAAELYKELAKRIASLGFRPTLCDVMVGEDPVSLSFVRIKQRAAEKVGLRFNLVQLPHSASEAEIVDAIKNAQLDIALCGLIVQLPLPPAISPEAVLSAIDSDVDVDLLNPESSNSFYKNQAVLVPPTAAAIMHIIDSLQLEMQDEKFLVVGQGSLVGKPTTHLLRQRNCTVAIADINTADTVQLLREATVVISGAGKPNLITGDNVAPGVGIIDAGTSESGGKISGDVDFESVLPKARFITPVPGGVGPVTVAKLIVNVVTIAERRSNP